MSTDGKTVSCLMVTIEAKPGDSSTPLEHEVVALLDTGATDCFITVELAKELGISLQDDEDQEEVHTASVNSNPHRGWEAKVNLRWKVDGSTTRPIRIAVTVAPVSSEFSLYLSHDFTMRHRDVWQAAFRQVMSKSHLNAIFKGPLSTTREKKQEDFIARMKAEKKERREAVTCSTVSPGVPRLPEVVPEDGTSLSAETGPVTSGSSTATSKND